MSYTSFRHSSTYSRTLTLLYKSRHSRLCSLFEMIPSPYVTIMEFDIEKLLEAPFEKVSAFLFIHLDTNSNKCSPPRVAMKRLPTLRLREITSPHLQYRPPPKVTFLLTLHPKAVRMVMKKISPKAQVVVTAAVLALADTAPSLVLVSIVQDPAHVLESVARIAVLVLETDIDVVAIVLHRAIVKIAQSPENAAREEEADQMIVLKEFLVDVPLLAQEITRILASRDDVRERPPEISLRKSPPSLNSILIIFF